MADYIYLLEHRLSPAQRSALATVGEVSRARGLTLFLVGGAVRDLTSGSPVRDLDVVVTGNALRLRKELEKAGAVIDGEYEAGQSLYLRFPGQVRVEFGSTLSVTYPKPGKAAVKPATILEDLRRRDFTANAMALSLNEGSYGLLMDPLNGVADIENRELRLVSNYGFIEDPVRMIRAARLAARLGWVLEEKTRTRYETGVQEGYISTLNDFHRGYELEEIFHEEDPLRVLKRLETDGWMKNLAPFWNSTKVNVAELERMREAQTQLQIQGIHPDPSAGNFPLLTAKLTAKEIASLKESFPRPGFVTQVEALEADTREVTAQLSGKSAASPSQSWRLLTSAKPEAVLQIAFSSKSPAIQAKLKSFAGEWPQARNRMPYALMQEMRITPELPGYNDLLEKLFFELMDGNLSTPEEVKAFLEPYSPPAPPPPVNMRRMRTAKKDAKPAKSRSRKARDADDDLEADAPDLPDDLESDEETKEPALDLDLDSVEDLDDGPADLAEDVPDEAPDEAVEDAEEEPAAKPAPAKNATSKRKASPPASPAVPRDGKTAPAIVSPPSSKPAPVKAASRAPEKGVPAKAPSTKAPVKAPPAEAAAKPPAKATPVKAPAATKAPTKAPAKKAVPAKSARRP